MPPPLHQRRPRSLSHGRPLSGRSKYSISHIGTKSISSKHTRRLIRNHHNLQKQLAKAVQSDKATLASDLREQIREEGGLELYQTASVNGADKQRGGDTSKKLIEFIGPFLESLQTRDHKNTRTKLKLLDVGALSLDTAASRLGVLEITSIDLRSREKGIVEQDFMARPIPSRGVEEDAEKFDIICLSLVLNYVPDAKLRGDMLSRTCLFMRHQSPTSSSKNVTLPQDESINASNLPMLFLVLPAPCITNSRYLNHQRLEEIMTSLGYSLLKQAVTAKLAYSLWQWHELSPSKKPQTLNKKLVNPGRLRNNFAIVLRA